MNICGFVGVLIK